MIKAIIFDLDGLIADTESSHFQAINKVFAKYGINISEEEYAEDWINNGFGVDDTLRKYNVKADADNLRQEKTRTYLELIGGGIESMPSAIPLINTLCAKYILAVASSSRTKSVNAVLDKLGIKHNFEVICSRERTMKKGPYPSMFLVTAKKLNGHPSECLVIEDAKKGFEVDKDTNALERIRHNLEVRGYLGCKD